MERAWFLCEKPLWIKTSTPQSVANIACPNKTDRWMSIQIMSISMFLFSKQGRVSFTHTQKNERTAPPSRVVESHLLSASTRLLSQNSIHGTLQPWRSEGKPWVMSGCQAGWPPHWARWSLEAFPLNAWQRGIGFCVIYTVMAPYQIFWTSLHGVIILHIGLQLTFTW